MLYSKLLLGGFAAMIVRADADTPVTETITVTAPCGVAANPGTQVVYTTVPQVTSMVVLSTTILEIATVIVPVGSVATESLSVPTYPAAGTFAPPVTYGVNTTVATSTTVVTTPRPSVQSTTSETEVPTTETAVATNGSIALGGPTVIVALVAIAFALL